MASKALWEPGLIVLTSRIESGNAVFRHLGVDRRQLWRRQAIRSHFLQVRV